ncbi:hypothetical protein ACHAWF_014622 [Thalassiosira exigua]
MTSAHLKHVIPLRHPRVDDKGEGDDDECDDGALDQSGVVESIEVVMGLDDDRSSGEGGVGADDDDDDGRGAPKHSISSTPRASSTGRNVSSSTTPGPRLSSISTVLESSPPSPASVTDDDDDDDDDDSDADGDGDEGEGGGRDDDDRFAAPLATRPPSPPSPSERARLRKLRRLRAPSPSDDLVSLPHLDRTSILTSLESRHLQGKIYTATGPILIAVNPFRRTDGLYGEECMEGYRRRGEGLPSEGEDDGSGVDGDGRGPAPHAASRPPPHAYRTADDAYRSMMRGMEDAVLAGGEGGGGGGPPGTRPSPGPRDPYGEHASADSLGGVRRGDSADDAAPPADQSVLVSGESGAGKTVTTKVVLSYLAMLSERIARASNSGSSGSPTGSKGGTKSGTKPTRRRRSPEFVRGHGGGVDALRVDSTEGGGRSASSRVLLSNPVLESLGNAQTLRNSNSSRFGKYVDVRFSSSGRLVGATVSTYLLERARVCRPPGNGERNYHVFYQLLAGCTSEERTEWGLSGRGTEDFRILDNDDGGTGGTYVRGDGVDDGTMHAETIEAMTTAVPGNGAASDGFGFTIDEGSRDGGPTDASVLERSHASLTAARLLGVSIDHLERALTYRTVSAGRDEAVSVPMDAGAARRGCEALATAVYGAVFDYVVEEVNASVSDRRAGASAAAGRGASIGVLDIFGFEVFPTNSLEQLCINYANESLQQQFNRHVFRLEQEEYEREGIGWDRVGFADNADALELIDGRRNLGILTLLDEQCVVPGGTDERLARRILGWCGGRPRFGATATQRAEGRFSVEHYAGPVEYSTEQWLEKNTDRLPVSVADLLKGSTADLVAKVWKFIRADPRPTRSGAPPSPGTSNAQQLPASVASRFSSQLASLRSRVDATAPHYVRCLKPNDAALPSGRAGSWDEGRVAEQLGCGGVLEALRVGRAGYPTRYALSAFWARYRALVAMRGTEDEVEDDGACNGVANVGAYAAGERSEVGRLVARIAFDIWEADRDPAAAKESAASFQDRGSTRLNIVTPDRSSKRPPSTFLKPELFNPIGMARPSSSQAFLSLDFDERCELAGLRLGKTKVFLRRGTFDRLEALRTHTLGRCASAVQRIARGALARRRFKRMREEMTGAARVICTAYRAYRERVRRREMESVCWPAAVKIQAVARGRAARRWFARAKRSLRRAKAARENELVNLRKELEDLRGELGVRTAERDAAKGSLRSLEKDAVERAGTSSLATEAETDDLRKELQARTAERDVLDVTFDEMRNKFERMNSDAKAEAAEMATLKEERDTMRKLVEHFEGEAAEIAETAASIDTEAKKQLKAMRKKLEARTSERDELRAERDLLLTQIQCIEGGATEMSEKVACIKAETRRQLRHLRNELESLTAERDKLSAEYDSFVETAAEEDIETQKQLSNLQKELSASAAESDELRAERDLLQSEVKSLKSDATEMTEKLALNETEARRELEHLQKELKLRMVERDGLTMERESLRTQAKCLELKPTEKGTKERDMQNQLQNLQNELKACEAERDKLWSSSDDLSRKVDRLGDECAKTAEIAVTNEAEAADLRRELLSVRGQLRNLSDEKRELLRETSVLRREASEAATAREAEMVGMREELTCAQQKIASLVADLHQSRCEQKRLSNAMTLLEHSSLESLNQATQEKHDLAGQNKYFSRQIEELSMEVNRAKSEENKKTASEEQLLLNSKVTSLNDLLRESNEEGHRLIIRMNSLEEKKERLETDLAVAKKDACWEQEQLNSKILSLEDLLLESRAVLESAKNGASEEESLLNSKVASLQDFLLESKEEGDRLLDRMQSLQKEKDNLITDIEVAKKEACREQEQLTCKIISLEDLLLESKDEEDRRLNIVKSLEEEKIQLQASIKEAEDKSKNEQNAASAAINHNQELSLKIQDDKEKASQEQGKLSSKIEYLKRLLLESTEEEEKLTERIKSLEIDHAVTLADVEESVEKLSQQVNSLSSELEFTKGINGSLSAQLKDAKKIGSEDYKRLTNMIASLEAELTASKQEEEQLNRSIEMIESSHAEALSRLEDENNVLTSQNQELSIRIEGLSSTNNSAISSLQEDNFCLENTLSKLKQGKVNEGNTCRGHQDRSFDDMVGMIQQECSDLIKKSQSMAKELEQSHSESAALEQVLAEASSYKLQNVSVLQALDDITNLKWESKEDEGMSMVEVVVNREVEKRLTALCHKIETRATNNASPETGMTVEVSLL